MKLSAVSCRLAILPATRRNAAGYLLSARNQKRRLIPSTAHLLLLLAVTQYKTGEKCNQSLTAGSCRLVAGGLKMQMADSHTSYMKAFCGCLLAIQINGVNNITAMAGRDLGGPSCLTTGTSGSGEGRLFLINPRTFFRLRLKMLLIFRYLTRDIIFTGICCGWLSVPVLTVRGFSGNLRKMPVR